MFYFAFEYKKSYKKGCYFSKHYDIMDKAYRLHIKFKKGVIYMSVSKEELLHIAKLANLKLNDNEIDNYLKNLEDILDYAEVIKNAKYFNGKKILVIDDTIATGKSMLDTCRTIIDTYDVKALTILTLF